MIKYLFENLPMSRIFSNLVVKFYFYILSYDIQRQGK